MVQMSNEIKRYVTYFMKSNLRVFILEMIILFILIPFVIFNETNSFSDFAHNRDYFITLSGMSIFSMCVLSIITPLYIFRYLHNKQSCDLYFSLPIKRSHLFLIDYILGVLLALIPLFINGFIASVIICIGNINLIFSALGFFAMLTISFLILYSFFSFLVLKCNNLLDSIIISGSYVILPIIMVLAIGVYLSSELSQVFVSYINIGNELIIIQKMFIFLLYPFAALAYFIVGQNTIVPLEMMEIIMYSVLWLLIGIFCFYIARKAYIARKEEDAQQRSKALCTYPFVIMASTISLILLTFASGGSKVVPTIIIFTLYVIMVFFANRKIKLRLKDVLFFVLIYVLVISFSFVFQKTKAFGLVKEVPTAEKIKYAGMDISYFSDEEGETTQEFIVTSQKDIPAFLDIQEMLMEDATGNFEESRLYIHIAYTLDDGREIYRNYSVDETELENLLNTIEKTKK